jgi:hypothetical protein
MELLPIVMLTSVGVAVLTSAVKTRKVTERVLWRPQTKVDQLHEQKIFARLLIQEVTMMQQSKDVSKQQVNDLLNYLSIFYRSASLMPFSTGKIRDNIEAASNALHFIEKIDHKYLSLINRLVESVVQAVLRTAGKKENAAQLLRTMESLAGLIAAFRKFSANEEDITQWKHEAMSKKPKA